MNILLIDPYLTGSHKRWALAYQAYSRHKISILSLSGHHWKWRMHGGAVTLSRKFLDNPGSPDLILATDMLDLTVFLALTRQKTAHIPTALYFHENQLTYPRSDEDKDISLKRDVHYSFINYSSALAADAVMFNSKYHQSCFLEALPEFLRRFPDHKELDTIEQIASKSEVLPIGMDYREIIPDSEIVKDPHIPLILWNHRWEYDKGPEDFFRAMIYLSESGVDFHLAVLGQQYTKVPEVFQVAREKLNRHIIKWGYTEDFNEYAAWLYRADIIPVTSIHDFFGMSVVEALYCNTYPLLPTHKVYQEYLPKDEVPEFFYDSFRELLERLANLLANISVVRTKNTRKWVEQYDWQHLVLKYDQSFQNLVNRIKYGNSQT